MGTIRVGKSSPVAYKSSGWTTVTNEDSPNTLSEEEKASFLASVKQMPKDKWVSTLRNAGFDDEANECERLLAEEHLQELRRSSRANRLAEIKAMDEEVQLPLLIEEGFDDEAKLLSEKLSAKQEHDDGGDGEYHEPQEERTGGEPNELSAESEKKQKRLRKKSCTKSSSKTKPVIENGQV